jgi:hypothetical protein
MAQQKGPMRKPRQSMDIAQLRSSLSWAIKRSERLLADPKLSAELLLKVTHALAQSAGVYRALIESTELEQRMQVLEQRLQGGNHEK